MYAIVDIAGQQFKVEKDQKLFVHRLEGEEGSKVTFEKVYLLDTDKKISVGDPVIKGASVSATILNHLKGDKVMVFKKKRRKGYKKLTGHRQYLTHIQIEDIAEKAAPGKTSAAAEKTAEPKAAAEKKPATTAKAAPKKTAAATEEKKTAAAEKKPAAATKAAPKKAAPKKTAASAEKKAAPAKPKATEAKKDESSDKEADKA